MTISSFGAVVGDLAFHPDGTALAFSDIEAPTLYLWYFRQNDAPLVLASVPPDFFAAHHQVVFSPDGHWVAANGRGDSLPIWQTTSPNLLIDLISHPLNEGGTTGISFNLDGNLLIAGARDGTLEAWDVKSGASLHLLPAHEGMLWTLALHPDGNLLATGGEDGWVRLWGIVE